MNAAAAQFRAASVFAWNDGALAWSVSTNSEPAHRCLSPVPEPSRRQAAGAGPVMVSGNWMLVAMDDACYVRDVRS